MFKNNETELLQCTITTHTRDHEANSNTCYTAGMEFLEEGDRLNIKDIARGRRSIFAPGKSFFGVVKLG